MGIDVAKLTKDIMRKKARAKYQEFLKEPSDQKKIVLGEGTLFQLPHLESASRLNLIEELCGCYNRLSKDESFDYAQRSQYLKKISKTVDKLDAKTDRINDAIREYKVSAEKRLPTYLNFRSSTNMLKGLSKSEVKNWVSDGVGRDVRRVERAVATGLPKRYLYDAHLILCFFFRWEMRSYTWHRDLSEKQKDDFLEKLLFHAKAAKECQEGAYTRMYRIEPEQYRLFAESQMVFLKAKGEIDKDEAKARLKNKALLKQLKGIYEEKSPSVQSIQEIERRLNRGLLDEYKYEAYLWLCYHCKEVLQKKSIGPVVKKKIKIKLEGYASEMWKLRIGKPIPIGVPSQLSVIYDKDEDYVFPESKEKFDVDGAKDEEGELNEQLSSFSQYLENITLQIYETGKPADDNALVMLKREAESVYKRFGRDRGWYKAPKALIIQKGEPLIKEGLPKEYLPKLYLNLCRCYKKLYQTEQMDDDHINFEHLLKIQYYANEVLGFDFAVAEDKNKASSYVFYAFDHLESLEREYVELSKNIAKVTVLPEKIDLKSRKPDSKLKEKKGAKVTEVSKSALVASQATMFKKGPSRESSVPKDNAKLRESHLDLAKKLSKSVDKNSPNAVKVWLQIILHLEKVIELSSAPHKLPGIRLTCAKYCNMIAQKHKEPQQIMFYLHLAKKHCEAAKGSAETEEFKVKVRQLLDSVDKRILEIEMSFDDSIALG